MTTSRRTFLGFLASLPAAVGLAKTASASEPESGLNGWPSRSARDAAMKPYKQLTAVEAVPYFTGANGLQPDTLYHCRIVADSSGQRSEWRRGDKLIWQTYTASKA